MKYGDLSGFLYQLEHPYPDLALVRAKHAQSLKIDGYGLTKIPERVLEKWSTFPKEQWGDINDSAQVEAYVLVEIDSKSLADLGIDGSLQLHHVEADEIDKKYVLNIKSGKRKKYLAIGGETTEFDIETEFEGILDIVDEAYTKHGSLLDEKSHTRLGNKIIKLMKRNGD